MSLTLSAIISRCGHEGGPFHQPRMLRAPRSTKFMLKMCRWTSISLPFNPISAVGKMRRVAGR